MLGNPSSAGDGVAREGAACGRDRVPDRLPSCQAVFVNARGEGACRACGPVGQTAHKAPRVWRTVEGERKACYDASMTDRESIVAYLKREADNIKEDDGPPGCNDMKAAMRTAYRSIAHQIEHGDDLTPAKPKPTIADLLALHDLDLGALAHKVGVTGEGFTTTQADALCAHLGEHPMSEDFVRVTVVRTIGSVHTGSMRATAALGAKVRAALSAPTIKVATPRVLLSADEAPCGALIIPDDDEYPMTIRYPDGRGWHIYATPLETTRKGWLWKEHGIEGPARLLAEGLTEPECRHLSGLSAADALVWCLARDKACATHDAAVIDRLQRDGDSLRSLLAVIRHALGAGDHDDIVKHARAIKARADRA